jgi:hypothetical protein
MPEYETAPLNTWWMMTEKTPEKSVPKGNGLTAADTTPFLKLAKAECCNYVESGPRQIKQYCYNEPPESGKQCVLTQGHQCKWFVEAVLPRNPAMVEEWKMMLLRGSDPHKDEVKPAPRIILKSCSCGKLFKRKSPRQRFCDDCAKKNRARLSRITSKRHRENKVAA